MESKRRRGLFRPLMYVAAAVVVIAGIVTRGDGLDREAAQPQEVAEVVLKKAQPAQSSGPTVSDQEFVQKVFIPELSRLANEYPVESVRLQMHSVMRKIESGEIQLGMRASPMEQNALAYCVNLPDKKVLGFVLVTVKDLYSRGDRDVIEDMLVGAVTHEGYHLLQQSNYGAGMSPQELQAAESDAWLYSVEKVYKPMHDAGRMRGMDADDAAVLATRYYTGAHGDKDHPAWVAWSKIATGLPLEAFTPGL